MIDVQWCIKLECRLHTLHVLNTFFTVVFVLRLQKVGFKGKLMDYVKYYPSGLPNDVNLMTLHPLSLQ